MNKLKKLVKRLLPPWRSAKYVWSPAHTVVTDYAEFAGVDVREVEKAINSYKALTKAEWDKLPPGSFGEKARAFYGTSLHYVCDILAANYTRTSQRETLDDFSPLYMKAITEHPGKRFLEFGGGTGVFCELVASLGKDVTYLDIPGRQFDFAKWRFEKYGIPVRMVLSDPAELRLEGEYDIIFTAAVMEHLEDPCPPTVTLCRHLAPGGALILLVDLTGEEEDMPMHRDVDIVRLHDAVAAEGLECVYGRNAFGSIWKRPA